MARTKATSSPVTAPTAPAHGHIGDGVVFYDGKDWIDARIYFAVDDDDMHASLTIQRTNAEAEYVEDVPHACAAGKGKRFWMWPAEADVLRAGLAGIA